MGHINALQNAEHERSPSVVGSMEPPDAPAATSAAPPGLASATAAPIAAPAPAMADRSNVVNVNVGVLGHVDSGKTSLVKALSTLLSTAALDKNPQSQQRGITLDLGFSAFTLPMPAHLQDAAGSEKDLLQFTLVDCPGHASLIRTIIGGAQIIDMMVLVVDANKGIQTQTAECIVIGEITTDKLIVVLNKIDLLPADERDARLERISTRIRKVFAATKFADAPIVATAAAVGGEKVASIAAAGSGGGSSGSGSGGGSGTLSQCTTMGVAELVDLIRCTIEVPRRVLTGPFYYAVDHCFAIKGHGTVLTGTVLSGSIALNGTIELPELQQQRKVKGMQMFRKSVRTAGQGDRVALCVTNLDPKLIERGIAVSPGTIPLLSTVVCLVKKVRFFRRSCKSNSKFHVSIGHTTVVATVLFYGANEIAALLAAGGKAPSGGGDAATAATTTAPASAVVANKTRPGKKAAAGDEGDRQSALNATYNNGFPAMVYPWETADFEYQDALLGSDGSDGKNKGEGEGEGGEGDRPVAPRNATAFGREPVQWALLQFQQPVYCPLGSLVIGSRLDAFSTSLDNDDAATSSTSSGGGSGEDGVPRRERASASHCRLAFFGPVREALPAGGPSHGLEKVRLFHWKQKDAAVFKVTDVRQGLCYEAIGWQLVKDGGSIDPFVGMKVDNERGEMGVIVGPFGAGGKFKVKFAVGVRLVVGARLTLRFKRFVHDKTKAMVQTGVEDKAAQVAALHASAGGLAGGGGGGGGGKSRPCFLSGKTA